MASDLKPSISVWTHFDAFRCVVAASGIVAFYSFFEMGVSAREILRGTPPPCWRTSSSGSISAMIGDSPICCCPQPRRRRWRCGSSGRRRPAKGRAGSSFRPPSRWRWPSWPSSSAPARLSSLATPSPALASNSDSWLSKSFNAVMIF